MDGRSVVRWAIAGIAIAGLAACVARSRPAPDVADAACSSQVLDSCRSRCGGASPHPESHEGRCEEVLHEVCRARCAEACEPRSDAEKKRVAALESRLDHECGSGESIEPETEPKTKPRPTPNPVDRLML